MPPMTSATGTLASAPLPQRTFKRMARDVIFFSLGTTTIAAFCALGAAAFTDVRFSVTFVILRWCVVAALLATPLIHQLTSRAIGWRLPWALATPLTALVLTTESICFDIISAQLH